MGSLYERIEQLCARNGINVTTMCREAGVSRGNLTDLKMGRQTGLSAKNTAKIASYFNVSVDYLLYGKETEAPTSGERSISDDDIKFALFGGDGEITDAMFEEVRQFAKFIKDREAQKKKE